MNCLAIFKSNGYLCITNLLKEQSHKITCFFIKQLLLVLFVVRTTGRFQILSNSREDTVFEFEIDGGVNLKYDTQLKEILKT